MNVLTVKRNLLLAFSVFITLFSACTKIHTTDIGSELLPSVDGVITKDTVFDVISKNVADTFIRVNISNDHSLGYVDDPLFGKTTAIVNVQLKPDFYPYTFEVGQDSLHLDSVVLVLSFKGGWGDTSKPLNLQVYEIEPENNFVHDTAYPSTFYPTHGNRITENPLGTSIDVRSLGNLFHPTLFHEDSLTTNQIRIRLDSNSFGNKLLHTFTQNTAYLNDTLFTAALKGFQIVPGQSSNGLVHVNLLDTNTKLALYYKYDRRDSAGKQDTTVRYFRANQFTSATCNTIIRNRIGTQFADFVPEKNRPNDSLVFLEGGPGSYTRITIPNLDSLPNIIVHRAELILEQEPDLSNPDEKYFTPPNLFLAAYSTDSMRRFAIPNATIFSAGYVSNLPQFGSLPIQRTGISGIEYSYSFDLSRYLQGIVTRKEKSYGLILWAPYYDGVYLAETSLINGGISTSPLNNPAFGRIRVGGGSSIPNKPHKMRLHIVYSKI